MQAVKRVAKNTGILYIQMGITVLMSLYTTRLVLAALGVDDFGIYNVVAGAIAMLGFLNVAMTAASQRFMSYSQGEGNLFKQKSIFNISLLLHICIAFIIVIILEIVGYFLFEGILKINPDRIETAKLVYHFMVGSTFFTIISVPYDAVINAHENMLLVAVLRIIETVLKLTIAIVITYNNEFDSLAIYGGLMAFIYVVLYCIRLAYCHNKYKEVVVNIKKYFDKPLFNEMTSFAGYSFLGSSTSIVAFYGQGLVLNMFFGTVVNAAQGIAGQVSGQLGAFSVTMLKALNPIISKSEGAGDRDFMLKASLVGSKLSFFLLIIFYVPVLLEMPYIFNLWLEEVPDYAIIFCRLLLIRNLIEQLFLTLYSSISAVGEIKKFQVYISALTLLPLLITYILFLFGFVPYTLYIVFIIYSMFYSGIVLFFAKKYCNLSITYFMSNIVARCVIIFMVVISISAIPIYFLPSSFYRLLLVSVLSSSLFFVAVWFIGLEAKERNYSLKVIKDFLKKQKTKK